MTMLSKNTSDLKSRLSQIVQLFRKNFGDAKPCGGEIRACSKTIEVTTKWSLTDVDMEKRVSYDTISVAARADKNPTFELIQPAKEHNESIIFTLNAFSKSKLRAVAKEVSIGEKKQEFIEIWKGETRLGVYDADFAGLHGKITTKGNWPSYEWSADESKLLFVAEKKLPTAESYFAKKLAPDSDVGELYRWKEDWGEQVEGIASPVVVVLDIKTMEAEVIEKPDFSLGQAIFTVDGKGIVGVSTSNKPYRLGSIFCNNRSQQLFHYEFETKQFKMLGACDKCAYNPRFDPSGNTLIYFQNEAGGPHMMASELLKIKWSSEHKESKVVVKIPRSPKENDFPGLYGPTIVKNSFSEDGKSVFLNSIWHSRMLVLEVDLETGNISNQSPDEKFGSWGLYGVHNGFLLASRSSPSIKTHVVLGRITNKNVEWLPVQDITEESDVEWKVLKLRPDDAPEQYFEAIYVAKKSNSKRPLIVLPHGGPHATSIASYSSTVNLFLDCGYSVLFVNYRGSLGFGEENLRSLPGRVGDVDIKDVYQAAKAVEADGQVSDLLLFGGSHGGFIIGHLAGQYPSTFKACSLRNPVTDLSTMGPSDIPDWYWYESGCKGNFTHGSLPTAEDLVKAFERSPISYAHNIIAPCYFFLGTNDLRVDKSQGLKLYKVLLAKGVDAKCNMYDDNHSLSKLKNESDSLIATITWFDKYTSK